MICVSHVTNLLFKDLILLRAEVHPGGNHASGHYSPSAGFLNMGFLIKSVEAASWFSMSHQTWQTGLQSQQHTWWKEIKTVSHKVLSDLQTLLSCTWGFIYKCTHTKQIFFKRLWGDLNEKCPPSTVCLRYLPLHPQVVALLLFGAGWVMKPLRGKVLLESACPCFQTWWPPSTSYQFSLCFLCEDKPVIL